MPSFTTHHTHNTTCTHTTHKTTNTTHTRQPTVILRVSSSMRKVNAWICAPPTSDHDPANAIFIYNCNNCNACNACNFLCGRIVFDLILNCDACNLLQSYCFRFYFRFVTVMILWKMVAQCGYWTFSCRTIRSRSCGESSHQRSFFPWIRGASVFND